ncbi:MAG: hypothetical protein OXD01_12975 [Gammaproteobacteria bacterium]|nr:hypothetical protein [Gammaproteobacteria bacterium]
MSRRVADGYGAINTGYTQSKGLPMKSGRIAAKPATDRIVAQFALSL